MKRHGFTLMEMLVSVVLIVLITLFMYGAIASSRLTSKTLSNHAGMENNKTMLYELFYRDIMESLWVKPIPTQSRRFTVLQMQTRNSLYDIAAPEVTWYVHAQTHQLIRLESAHMLTLPLRDELGSMVHADVFAQDVEDFNVYGAMISDSNQTTGASSDDNKTQSEQASEKSQTQGALHNNRFLLFLRTKKEPSMLLEIAL